jgi:hypothetical protein
MYKFEVEHYMHELTIVNSCNYIDTKEKFRHLKQLTFKGTLRHMFFRVYRLEIHLVMLVSLTQLCDWV